MRQKSGENPVFPAKTENRTENKKLKSKHPTDRGLFMKLAVLTSEERVRAYTDPAMIPPETEFIQLGQDYTEEDVIRKAHDADFILVDAILPVTKKMIDSMPHLRMIHSEGVAYNKIDLKAASEAGVFVCNNKAVNAGAVAEHAVLLMLSVLRRLREGDRLVREGHQIDAKSRFILEGIPELESCHVGLVGFGMIAKETARRLSAFGCRISYYKPNRAPEDIEKEFGVEWLPFEELCRQCDIISLHTPVLPETTHMINEKAISLMKNNVVIINTARGDLIDQEALCSALKAGKIAGAGLDTLTPEPVTPENPLLNLPEDAADRIIFSPHVAGTTKNVFEKIYRTIWTNIRKAGSGERPDNIVNDI